MADAAGDQSTTTTPATAAALSGSPPAVVGADGGLAAKVPLHFPSLADYQQAPVLDLPDPLLFDPKFFADLLQRVLLAVQHAGAHPQDVCGAVVQVNKLGLPEGV